ncbi:MAG: metalloregulator ArsR/SmtB family transcription factor [Hyphomicrobium sp.]|nr:metalloregulator ArsR/SmtB family transcription factor [Hyphomicrobium sp.]
MSETLKTSELVGALKAAAEPTRLRILLLLSKGELTVKDLTQILGQSQPRISRHLKLLAEAGLVERFRDGSWVYFHVSDRSGGGRLTRRLLQAVDPNDPVLRRDRERADALRRDRERAAQSYFDAHAADWDRIRTLYLSEKDIEAAMSKALGLGPFKLLVDLGTGTGRVLELFADRYERGLGFDVSRSMLAYAEMKFAAAGLDRAEVRHGDIYNLTLGNGVADGVVMHQIIHYLSEPAMAIAEAARILAPGGRLLVVDFAPHDLEFLREDHAHERLGVPADHLAQWTREAGLVVKTTETLAPPPDGEGPKLTVILQVAEKSPENPPLKAATTGGKVMEEAG